MTYREMQSLFELKATSQYGAKVDKPLSSEIEMWLEAGKQKFKKTRYSGVNFKRLGFEQDQKRIEDLRLLKVTEILDKYATVDTSNEYDIHQFIIPESYWITTGEAALILPVSDEAKRCWSVDKDGNYIETRTSLIECTDENIDEKLTNHLSDHLFNGSITRPLRIHSAFTIDIYTDKNYKVSNLILTYLKNPSKIDIHTNPNAEYLDFPESVHEEIVNVAVQLYLENKTNPRYNTFSNEVNTME